MIERADSEYVLRPEKVRWISSGSKQGTNGAVKPAKLSNPEYILAKKLDRGHANI
jgi:hypothetical protein